MTRVVPDRRGKTLIREIRQWVREGARIASDDERSFMDLKSWGYFHEHVNHLQKEWVRGDVHTNTIETFWSILKRGINGTHIWVSARRVQRYLWEFEFRYDLRKQPHLMFDLLLLAFPRPLRA